MMFNFKLLNPLDKINFGKEKQSFSVLGGLIIFLYSSSTGIWQWEIKSFFLIINVSMPFFDSG